MGCSALICGRFDDSQESCFQASKPSNMGSAVLESGRCAGIHEFDFKLQNVHMDCVDVQGFLFANTQELNVRSRNAQIFAVPTCKRVDLLMYKNSSFSMRNAEICAVLSSKEFDLLMLRNRVFRQLKDHKCAVQA